MLNHRSVLVPYCYSKMHGSQDSTLITEGSAEQLFEMLCREIDKQYIIIDGLDECRIEQRRILLHILTRTVQKCDEKLDWGSPRLLVVSHKLGDIEDAMKIGYALELRRDDNRKDIKAFATNEISRLRAKFPQLELDVAEEIQELTEGYSQGKPCMFPSTCCLLKG